MVEIYLMSIERFSFIQSQPFFMFPLYFGLLLHSRAVGYRVANSIKHIEISHTTQPSNLICLQMEHKRRIIYMWIANSVLIMSKSSPTPGEGYEYS